MYLQHYADRVQRAIRRLSREQDGATAREVAEYLTGNGHRITPRRAARYLEILATANEYTHQHGVKYYA